MENPGNRSQKLVLWGFYLLVNLLILFLAHFLISRVSAGHLFLVRLPWDAPPQNFEVIDGELTAHQFHLPALFVVAVLSILFQYVLQQIRVNRDRGLTPTSLWRPRYLFYAMLFFSFTDLCSTLWFMHAQAIDLEAHPGIRLLTASLGRTVGPSFAKLFQCAGILFITAAYPRYWRLIAWIGILLAATATFHNTFTQL